MYKNYLIWLFFQSLFAQFYVLVYFNALYYKLISLKMSVVTLLFHNNVFYNILCNKNIISFVKTIIFQLLSNFLTQIWKNLFTYLVKKIKPLTLTHIFKFRSLIPIVPSCSPKGFWVFMHCFLCYCALRCQILTI